MSLPKLVNALATGFRGFGSAIELLEAEWGSEEAPITVSMSELGRAVVREAGDDFSEDDIAEIFRRVERILRRGADEEKDAVATGFLEAIAAAIDRSPERRWILDYAGPEASEYLAAWDRFCGLS